MTPRRLGALSLGFARQARLARILKLAGYQLRPGIPLRSPDFDAFVAWGRDGPARRAAWAAGRTGKPLLTLEDGFLRSLDGGWGGRSPLAQPLSILPDWSGVNYDATRPSDLENLLAGEGWETPELIARARAGIALLRDRRLSKYNAVPDEGEWGAATPPDPGFVLVVDQTWGDASIRWGGAGPETFRDMLAAARVDKPSAEIVIRTHPDVVSGRRRGHFSPADLDKGMRLFAEPLNPWALLERASKVYAVTSQLGFEAMMAENPVRLFGAPYYAGWGLAEGEDLSLAPRRGKRRSIEEVFAAAWLLQPLYYDPFKDELTDFETVAEILTCLRAANSENRRPTICVGMSRWKRPTVARLLSSTDGRPEFEDDPGRAVDRAAARGARVIVWASKERPGLAEDCAARGVPLVRMEDGFLRSVGLGAALTPALSIALDQSGIYYDPTRPSDLEAMIQAGGFDAELLARARTLRARIVRAGLSKYNIGAIDDFEPKIGRKVLLVPGQVEDDASVHLGACGIRTNLDLLRAARRARPDATLIYKPHPDVEAGLRAGEVPAAELARLADHVARNAAPATLIERADEVWTMTSLMGFEALMRGKRVTCRGHPFYVGWGLTEDAAPIPRRTRRATLDELVAAALILYPRYLDPLSGLPCEVEVVVDRLIAASQAPRSARSGAGLRALSALLGAWRQVVPRA